VGPQWEAVEEDGEGDGMKDASPVVEVEAPDRVSQDMKGAYSRSGACCHDFRMVVPLEALMDEDPKVAGLKGSPDCQLPAAGET